MPTIYKNIVTPTNGTAPDILIAGGKVEIGPGATQGTDGFGDTKTATHGLLACAAAAPIGKSSAAYVFMAVDGSAAWLDSDPEGGHLPTSRAFKVGRAWKGSNGNYIICQGKRANGHVSYNIAGDPVPRKLIDQGSSATPVTPVSPFQGGGQMTYEVRVTTKGTGTANLMVVDTAGNLISSKPYSGANNLSDTLVIPNVGDIVQFTTDPGVTITVLVTKGTENV